MNLDNRLRIPNHFEELCSLLEREVAYTRFGGSLGLLKLPLCASSRPSKPPGCSAWLVASTRVDSALCMVPVNCSLGMTCVPRRGVRRWRPKAKRGFSFMPTCELRLDSNVNVLQLRRFSIQTKFLGYVMPAELL
jgi:hypothetical protein